MKRTLLAMPLALAGALARPVPALPALLRAADLDADIMWRTDSGPGLDPAARISLNGALPVLDLIEQTLAQATPHDATALEAATWQLADGGTLQLGTKECLNRHVRIELHPLADLLTRLPDPQMAFAAARRADAPIFSETCTPSYDDLAPSRQQRPENLIDLITSTIEPGQWQENGGAAATIDPSNPVLIISAPDCIHRRIAGPRAPR